MGGVILPSSKSSERYNALNGLRTLACISIVTMHVKANTNILPTDSFLTTNIISFAGDFVSLFMLISAFSLCCGYYQRFADQTISMNDFYCKRYKRIWPFFTLLVLIDVAVKLITEHFSWSQSMQAELIEAFADITLAFGLISGNDISVIGVGWFLGIIFLFYMIFPFFTFLMHTKRRAYLSLLVIVLLYISVQNYFMPVKHVGFGNRSFIHCAPFFVVGGILYLNRKEIVDWSQKALVRVALVTTALAFTLYFFVWPEYRFPLSNLVMYFLWVTYAISELASKRKCTVLNNPFMTFFSGISMEVYLCHMLFFRIVERVHIVQYIENNDWHYYITCLLVLTGATCFAVVWKQIERHFTLIPLRFFCDKL